MGKRKRSAAFEVVPATDNTDESDHDMQLEQPKQPVDELDDAQLHQQEDDQYDSSTHHQPLLDDTDSSLPAYYLNLSDFTSQLAHPDAAVVESALARFIAQVKGEHTEHKANPAPLPTDPPSPLLAAYIATSPQAHELFALLSRPSSSYTFSAKLLDALHLILSTRYHAPSTSLLPVLSALARRFLRSHVRLLYRLMGLQDTRLPAVALRLLTTLCTLSHDLLRDTIHSLDLHNKALLSIASRGQQAKSGKAGEGKAALGEAKEKRLQQLQRLRTAYLSLFLLLIRSTDPDVVATLLASPPYISSVLKGLKADDVDTVRNVLAALVTVLEVRGISDELRYTALFSSHTLDTLTRLYIEDEREGGRLGGVVYEFFAAVVRVVRSGHAWSVEHREFSRWKYHKQLLTRLLSSLHPTVSSPHQQLSLSILSSFPSLLPSYITHLSVAFEPRLSTRYVANVALLCRLLDLPLSVSHLHFLASECQSAGQFSQLVLSHLLPTALTKLLLSQSIQHVNPLVQLTALTLLSTLLHRYSHLLTLLTPTLTSNPSYQPDLSTELRKRLPDIQVVFGLRAKLFPPPTAVAASAVESERRVELYGRVLDVLGLYQRLLVSVGVEEVGSSGGGGGSSGKVDMWKLLLTPAPFTWRTTQQLLTLLLASNNSPRLFHLPQRLVREESKADEQQPAEDEVKPTSYFGHLLSILLHCRQHFATASDAAATVHRQTMELITTALSRTGSYSAVSPSHRIELVAFLLLLTPATLPFLEHVIALTQSKPPATAALPSFPLLRAALYGRGWVGTAREYEHASGYVSAVLGRLLTVVNEQRAEVAEAVVYLAKGAEADESKSVDDTNEEKVARATRSGVVQQLREDPRYHAVLAHVASLLSDSTTVPKLASSMKQHPFSRLSRMSDEQWLTQLPALVRDALSSGSARHSLLLHLALHNERPLLASEWMQQQLTADEQITESTAVKTLVSSLQPSILFCPTQLPDCGPAVSLVCQRWTRDGLSAAEQLVLLTELTSVLVDALGAVAAGSISGSSILVSLSALLSLVHSLVLPVDSPSAGSIVGRMSAVFTVEREGKRLVDFFLSPSDVLPTPLSSTVTLAVTSLIHSALSAGATSDLQPLCDPFLLPLVASCLTVVQSSPSVAVPLPFLVLASLSSYLSSAQLTALTNALLCSPVAAGWLRVLSRLGELARVLLSHSPARAFAVIAEQLSVAGEDSDEDEQQALDVLAFELLQTSPSDTVSASLRASLVPEQLFTAALSRPSAIRLRLVTTLLCSTASVVYVQPFATHVLKQLSTSSRQAELLSFLPSLAAYVRATAALAASLLPSSHSAVVAVLMDVLRGCYLPAVKNTSVELAVVQQVDELVKAAVDADVLSPDDRKTMLTLLLSPSVSKDGSERKEQLANDEAERHAEEPRKKDKDTITQPALSIACYLLSFPSSTEATAVLPQASLLLIRVLNTLMTQFKVDVSGGSGAVAEYEQALLSAAISLLGGQSSLPVVELPADAGIDIAEEQTVKRGRFAALSAYSPFLSLTSLVATSSPSIASKLLTRFFTSALRSRFDQPDTHRLVFLLLQLQLQPHDRTKLSATLSLHPASLLAAPPSSRIALEAMGDTRVESLSAHTVFDLLVSHSQFVPTLLPATSTSAAASSVSLRLSLLHLLYLLFNFPVSPAPIPAPSSLVSVLTSAYTGTHSPLDVTLFCLLRLLASSASSSAVVSSRTRWGEVGQQQLRVLMASGENGSAVTRLDDDSVWVYTAFLSPQLQRGPLLSTALLHIPQSLTTLSVFTPQDSKHKQQRDEGSVAAAAGGMGGDVLSSHYSPHFVLPFFLHQFRHTQSDIRRLIDSGVLAYALHALSHPHLAVRKLAYKLVAKFYSEMERTQADEDKLQAERTAQRAQQQDNQPPAASATTPSDYHDPKRQRTLAHVTFKEQPELLFLLTALRNAITTPHMHLSCVLTSFLASASVVLLHPGHSLYRPINRFLTLSPSLPLRSVPLLHDLLMSRRADEWRRDRAWLLRWLDDAAAGGGVKEWHILRRRRVLSTLMTFHDSRHADRYTRTLVLDFIKRVVLMGRDRAECVEGEEAECVAGEGVALAGLVRNHGLLVWLRQMVAGQELGLATLVPAMELALLVVREVKRRLPDEAPKLEEVEETEVKEVKHAAMEGIDDSEGESDAMSDVEDDVTESNEQARKDEEEVADSEVAEGEDKDVNEQAEVTDKDDTPAGRAKAARALSRRRVGLAQDMQLLASSLLQRLTRTLQQQTEATPKPQAASDGETVEGASKAEDDNGMGQLGFGSSSAQSLSASLPTISLCLSLLRALAVTARKARKASGVDQSTSRLTALLCSAGCLNVSLIPSQAALLCSSAPQLSESSRVDIFHTITLSALTLPLISADGLEYEKRSLVNVVEWTHAYVLAAERGGNESTVLVVQWLKWLASLLAGQQWLRDWLLASEQLVARELLSLYPLLMPPTSPHISPSALAQLNRTLLHFDSLLPANQQLSHRMQPNSHYSSLRSSYQQLRHDFDEQPSIEQASDWGTEVKAAVLLQDVWLVGSAGDGAAQTAVNLHSVTLQQREQGRQNGNAAPRVNGMRNKRK